MAISPRNMRIGGATFVAVFLVVGAYVLPGISVPQTKQVNAELTDDLLASYVSKDTDQDGLPDWQEALYGTDLNKPDTDGDGVTDGEAVRQGLLTPTALASQLPTDPIGEEDIPGTEPAPGSITEQFSRTFFEAFLAASDGQPLSESAQQELTERLLADFTTISSNLLISKYRQVSIQVDSSASLSAYAAGVESAIQSNEVSEGEGDLLLLAQGFIEQEDPTVRPKLLRLADAYDNVAKDLLKVRVPPHLAENHLKLVRAYDTASKSARAISNYNEDPLAVLGALKMILPSFQDIVASIELIAEDILKNGEPGAGEPGSFIVLFARSAQ